MKKSKMIDVMNYTIIENLKKKSIFVTTILVALVCVLVLPIIAYISLEGKKIDKDDVLIKKIYIYDGTDFGDAGYANLKSMSKDYKDIEIEYKSIYDFVNKDNVSKSDSDEKSKKKKDKQEKKTLTKYAIRQFGQQVNKSIEDNNGNAVVIARIEHYKNEITVTNIKDNKDNDKITVDLTIPKDSKIKKSSATTLGNYINQLLTMKKYELSAKDEGELLELMAGVNVSINTLGKGKDNGMISTMKILVPMVFSAIMYFMLMTYGQSLCNGMITEKSSKIIELLVAHIKPSRLIIGKVLGCVTIAVGQILIWGISVLIGLKCANVYAYDLKGKVFINVDSIIKLIKESNIDSAFSIGSIIIAVIVLLMGFLFYCIYAAICGSFINKPDEASSVFAVYTYTNVIGFMSVYLGTIMEKKSFVEVSRYIPFCAPYSVPADVILGEISINQALIIALIMLICIVVIINILGNLYEKLVFNQLSVKELIKSRANR